MAKQVVGLFDTLSAAQTAVQALRDAGFTSEDISLVANNRSRVYDSETQDTSEAAEGAGAGATAGTVVGGLAGLLLGVGALTIPGIGPVIGGGLLLSALGTTALGAGIGAATGGLLGALVGAGIPENDANIYAEGVRRGGALVTVQASTDVEADRAAALLDQYGVVDIDERGTTYRDSGWNRFDENASYDDNTSDYAESSKLGTVTGGTAGALTGAAIGAAGGPVGVVVGGLAGAVAGGGLGAAADTAGEGAKDATVGDTSYQHDSASADYQDSSKIGTVGGGAAGAMTGAAIGAVGGPVGAVIGGVAGAIAGGTAGAVGDTLGEKAEDAATSASLNTPSSYSSAATTPSSPNQTARIEDATTHSSDYTASTTDTTYANTDLGANPVNTRAAQIFSDAHHTSNVADDAATNYDESSKLGTFTGGTAGAVTGAAMGAVGGPVGAVIGGVAGALAGGSAGAVGDTLGERAEDELDADRPDYTTRPMNTYDATNTNEGPIERGASKAGNAVERGTGLDLDRDGDVGQRDPRNNI